MSSYLMPSSGPFIRIGVVGCGRAGRTICLAIDSGRVHADLSAICDTDADRVQNLMFQLKRPTRSMSLHGLVASVDLVIEATNRHVAPVVIMGALDGGKDVLVTNTAAILARDDFGRLAYDRGLTIFAANALMNGINALNTAAATPEARAVLTITCPRPLVADAPFLRGREAKKSEKPQTVFQGEALDAIAALPAVANVVAAALIGAGGAELLVQVRTQDRDKATDIELSVRVGDQETSARARVPSSERDVVDPEATGLLVVGFLKALVSPVRLA